MTADERAEYGEDLDESWDSADSGAYQDGYERGEADAAEGLPFDDSGLSGAAWSGYWDGYRAKDAARGGRVEP